MNPPASSAAAQPDVRMRGFQQRTEVSAVLQLLDSRLHRLGAEEVGLREAAGRVLAADVTATVAIPPFARAAMDGYVYVSRGRRET